MENTFARMRKRANLKQETIAKHMSVTQSAVSQWENGSTLPRADLLPKLADLYECSIDELLDRPTRDTA